MSARIARAAIESLETRRHFAVTILNNGYDAGSMDVTVDAYGAFGIIPVGGPVSYGDRKVGNLGEINKSFVLFSPSRSFLTEGSEQLVDENGFPYTYTDPNTGQLAISVPGYDSNFAPVSFSSTSDNQAVSNFIVEGNDSNGKAYKYDITLTQTLDSVKETDLSRYTTTNGVKYQSTLTQTYSITDMLGTSSAFSLSRYIEPRQNAFQGSGGPDFYGHNAAFDSGQTLVVGGIGNGNFIEVHSYGGTFNSAAINAAGLDAALIRNNGVVGSGGIVGDTGDGIANINASPAFFAGLAQQYDFVLGARQTAEFTTITTIGQSTPIQLQNAISATQTGGTVIPVVGDFALDQSSYNFDFAKDSAGTVKNLNVTINRLGGSSGAASVVLTPVFTSGQTPSTAVSLSPPPTIDFLDGQTSVTIPITIDATLAGATNTTFQLALSTSTTGSSIISPGLSTVNVYPTAASFTPAATTYNTTSRDSSLTITINRTGNINGVASVLVTTANGTATAGVDYTAVNTRLDFADGETSKTITIPILPGTQDNSNQTFTVNLTGTTPGGTGSGDTSVITSSVISVTRSALDVTSPFVTGISTLAGKRGIDALFVTFSESLKGPGDLSAYTLLSRTSEGASGSAKTKSIPIVGASYDAATKTVRLTPKSALAFNKNFQITVRPNASLTDLTGNTIKQSNNLDAYVALFSRGNKVAFVDRSGDAVTLTMKNGSFELIRQSSGEAATVTLFGSGVTTSLFSGVVKQTRGAAGTTTRPTIVNPTSATVSLPVTQFNSAS